MRIAFPAWRGLLRAQLSNALRASGRDRLRFDDPLAARARFRESWSARPNVKAAAGWLATWLPKGLRNAASIKSGGCPFSPFCPFSPRSAPPLPAIRRSLPTLRTRAGLPRQHRQEIAQLPATGWGESTDYSRGSRRGGFPARRAAPSPSPRDAPRTRPARTGSESRSDKVTHQTRGNSCRTGNSSTMRKPRSNISRG